MWRVNTRARNGVCTRDRKRSILLINNNNNNNKHLCDKFDIIVTQQ